MLSAFFFVSCFPALFFLWLPKKAGRAYFSLFFTLQSKKKASAAGYKNEEKGALRAAQTGRAAQGRAAGKYPCVWYPPPLPVGAPWEPLGMGFQEAVLFGVPLCAWSGV